MRWLLVAGVACRDHDFHKDEPEDTALFDCQPYELECPDCTLDENLAVPGPLRHWRCEDPELGELTVVTHRADGLLADDEHYYDDAGQRVAARRIHDEPYPVCDADTRRTDEWWGVVLACDPTCEVDPSLQQADPGLPAC